MSYDNKYDSSYKDSYVAKPSYPESYNNYKPAY
jgi:hypothetical protein